MRVLRRVDRGEWMCGVFCAVSGRWGRFCCIAFDMLSSALWCGLQSRDWPGVTVSFVLVVMLLVCVAGELVVIGVLMGRRARMLVLGVAVEV